MNSQVYVLEAFLTYVKACTPDSKDFAGAVFPAR